MESIRKLNVGIIEIEENEPNDVKPKTNSLSVYHSSNFNLPRPHSEYKPRTAGYN